MANRKVIYLRTELLQNQFDQVEKISRELQADGFVVDAFNTAICVNGKYDENGDKALCSEADADSIMKKYEHLRRNEMAGNRIDVVWF